MELRHLRAFVTVVDEGTFTDAAIALGTTQATVSRTVAALETDLGAQLLQRSAHGVHLTARGRLALGHARRILAEAGRLREQVGGDGGELRIGFAWSALGRHTLELQRRWAAAHPGSQIVFVHANTPTAGLAEGRAELAVTRREPRDRRLRATPIGMEARYAALGREDPLARRRTVSMRDFGGRVVAVDARTGTTTVDLWPPDHAPSATRDTQDMEEWLALIAAGHASGMTTEATAYQHPRPGIVYRRVRDAPSVPVWLAWWRDDPPAQLDEVVALASGLYAAPGA